MAVVSTSSTPPWFTVPALTAAPAFFETGTASPVNALVHGRLAARDAAIERDACSGADQQTGSDHDPGGGDVCARREGGGVGGELHHRRDGRSGTIHRAIFEPLRDGEQEADGGALAPFADGHRPDDSDRHQEVDVEHPLAQGPEPLFRDRRQADRDRDERRVLGRREPRGEHRDANEGAGRHETPGDAARSAAVLVAAVLRSRYLRVIMLVSCVVVLGAFAQRRCGRHESSA